MDCNTNNDEHFTVYDFNPQNLPDEMLKAVGLVVVAASQTEHIVQQFLGGLLQIDDVTTIATTSRMSGPLKEHIIKAVAELRAPYANEIDQIDDLLDEIRNALDKRHIIAHNAIARHPETNEMFSFRERVKGSVQVDLEPISAADIEKDAALIYKAGMDLMDFMTLRGLNPSHRTEPLRVPLKRDKKARERRRNPDSLEPSK